MPEIFEEEIIIEEPEIRCAVIDNGIVKNIAIAKESFATKMGWMPVVDGAQIGWGYKDGAFIEPPKTDTPVELDVLSTDLWAIPSDGVTYATVTYTSDTDVYFVVNDIIHTISPENSIATLEITADASGPIKVQVKSQQLIITAIEVPL